MQDRVVQSANWCVCCSSWRAAEFIFEYVKPCLHCVAPCYQATGAQELLHCTRQPTVALHAAHTAKAHQGRHHRATECHSVQNPSRSLYISC